MGIIAVYPDFKDLVLQAKVEKYLNLSETFCTMFSSWNFHTIAHCSVVRVQHRPEICNSKHLKGQVKTTSVLA